MRHRSGHARIGRAICAVLALVLAATMSIGLSAPTAHADDLDDQKKRIQKKLEQTRKDLNESSEELNERAAVLEESRIRLADARAQLEQTQRDLAAAKKRDAELASKLKTEQQLLTEAKQAVTEGIARLEAQRARVGEIVQVQWQQRTNMLPVAVLTQAGSTRDFQTRIQWSTTMFDAAEAKITELERLQRELNGKRAEQSAIEKKVAAQRAEAAENLELQKKLEADSRAHAAQVEQLVQANQDAKKAAKKAVADDEARYAELESEREKVEQRIKKRIEAEKKRQAELEKKRKERERAAARNKAKNKNNSGNSSGGGGGSGGGGNSGGGNSNGGGGKAFIYPVNGPITSPYGMRLHPVTGIYKLHDGTDFGAGCGTPIRAARSGVVAEKYFNAAWGNRLVVDHGSVNGRYISTAYNHATGYTVGVGQRVSQGQVIGYVGTTGWSTGCHLHLNLYVNGSVTNPMNHL